MSNFIQNHSCFYNCSLQFNKFSPLLFSCKYLRKPVKVLSAAGTRQEKARFYTGRLNLRASGFYIKETYFRIRECEFEFVLMGLLYYENGERSVLILLRMYSHSIPCYVWKTARRPKLALLQVNNCWGIYRCNRFFFVCLSICLCAYAR